MGILGIENRTENWKTAYYFSPFFRDKHARLQLAQKLIANHIGSDSKLEPRDVHIELFWKGMRDHLFRPGRKKGDIILNECVTKQLVSAYLNSFAELRKTVEASQLFSPLGDDNYVVATANQQKRLASNLLGAEIDIVLATKDYILIGEAKDESSLKGDGRRNLVHQLVLQYVMARVLVDLKGDQRNLIPFVVVNEKKLRSTRDAGQVKFMVSRGWMNKKNVLIWDNISDV